MPIRVLALVLFAALAPLRGQAALTAPVAATGFVARTIEHGGATHRYVLFVPPGYDATRAWPLIVFLHGAGECGRDGWKHVSVGLGTAVMNDVAAWPFLVLFPQKPDVRDAWEDHDALVMAMVERTRATHAVDPARIFLTGLSQGGHGTWVIGARHQDLFAALAPVCGYGDAPALAKDLVRRPIWAFHGDADRAVPIAQSRALVAAVREAGGSALLTEYPGVGHNSWDKAYREMGLARWFLAAADDPRGAAYRTHPEFVDRLTLHVVDTWSTAASPPGGGTTRTRVEFGPEGLTWQVASEVTAGDAPTPRSGRLDAVAARELVSARLRQLEAAGALRLPDPVGVATSAAAAEDGHAYTLEIDVEGAAGPWRYHRAIPAAAHRDAVLRDVVAAIERAIGSVSKGD